jgi:hypothetical protein
MLDQLIPAPRKVEESAIDLAAPPSAVWSYVRHGDLASSPFSRALFALRTLPSRLGGHAAGREPLRLCIDDFQSTPEHPGFQLLGESPPHELVVGAIGKVFQLDIPFVHVAGAEAYAAFAEPGWVKVAWALRVLPLGDADSRVIVEVRVDATDAATWTEFEHYWRLIGPGSHFVRHALLAGLRRHFGDPDAHEEALALAGDPLLPDPGGQLTHSITIRAEPEEIWPWLLQMGAKRAGFYAIDALDNDGMTSARELHPELLELRVGDVIPASRAAEDGFEVLALVPQRALVLGGLFDVDAHKQLPFTQARPVRYWHVTWAFVLERRGDKCTRLHVRARAAFPADERLHLAWIRPVHTLMQTAQLRHLAARAEGRLARDTLRDVAEGVGGAAIIAVAWLSPFMRTARKHWGLSAAEAERERPGDNLVPKPRWWWTHAVEVDLPAERVWPWVAQVGADRGGFYSYQWLENLAGCNVRNAEAIHAAWTHQVGDALVLHPKMPPLRVVSVESGKSLVAFGAPDEAARAAGRPWAAASWAFLLEPLAEQRCRVVSRFRSDCSDDAATRLTQGPALLEPVGFAMDRRMLLGIRERATAAAHRDG